MHRLIALTALLAACGGGKDDPTTDPTGSLTDPTGSLTDPTGTNPTDPTDPVTTPSTGDGCDDPAWAEADVCTAWLVNGTGTEADIIRDVIGAAPEVDVRRLSFVSSGGEDFLRVEASGIPNYVVQIEQSHLDTLMARPKAASDFVGGAPTVQVGDLVTFGQDIGYSSTGCVNDEGYGYWPPGPSCPEDVGHDVYFPLEPTPAAADCATGLNTIGLWANGVSVFNWWDGQAYDTDGDWMYLAPVAEIYDVDLCNGHAAGDTYHHHSEPHCLTELLGDDGSAHSPVIGYAADGYPIRGGWQADGERAQSCWRTRDYDTPNDPTGCGGGGVRDCQLNDPTDVSMGTFAVGMGPSTGGSITSLSGNPIDATSGLFLGDYWFDADCEAAGGLDEHNGHDHDGLGYHYHVTDSFPFHVGPTFAGELSSNAVATCWDGNIPQGPGGGGPP